MVTQMILTEDQTKEIVELLRRHVNPEAIYLFGSQAGRQALEKNSDVDLCLIVSDAEEPYRRTVDAYQALQKLPFPKDIITRRRSRFEERSAWPFSLEHDVKRNGRLLYSA
jgi:predicted nucleotidyltransferase